MTHLEEYNKIINFRKTNPLTEDQYDEKHHIVPKSICPILKDSPENIVKLSAQEHFLAHYHLWLAFRDELKEKTWAKKMCYAFSRMKQQLLKCDDVESMAKLYKEVRVEFAKVHSETLKGHRSWSKGKPSPWKGRHPTEETRKKMSDAHKDKSPWNKGKHSIYSKEALERMAQHGSRNPNFGKHLSEETKLKISQANKGRVFSIDHRRKLSEAARNRK